MKKLEDICVAFLNGYIYCTITEQLITGRIHRSDLDKLKKTAVECMKDYIEHSDYSTEEKEELKNNYELGADVTLKGINKGCVIATNCMNKQDTPRMKSILNTLALASVSTSRAQHSKMQSLRIERSYDK